MAGIGFQLRKILQRDSLTGDLSAYVYAGIISAGPLILSILGILLIGVLSLGVVIPPQLIVQFQISVTYLIAFSLVLTGLVQLLFTRFISDRLFEGRHDRVLPNYNGIVTVTTLTAGTVGLGLALTVFDGTGLLYRLLMVMGFVVLCNLWLCIIFLASLKRYAVILLAFFVGYVATVGIAVGLRGYGLEGLMGGFVAGHVVMLGWMSTAILRAYVDDPSQYLDFQVFDRRYVYPSLMLTGLFFNLGVWLDKFMFWFSHAGHAVIGPLRASVIYDLPIFLSYLCIIPGMAVFLLRLETDFADSYNGYYWAVRNGRDLSHIRQMRDEMVYSARTGLYEILKIQMLVTLLIFAFGDNLLESAGISVLYFPLLKIDVVAASLQVLFLGCLNIFLYLDRRRIVLILSALFVCLNGLLTWGTLAIGPDAYGYGFAGALLIVVLLAVFMLNRSLGRLEYETYMLQQM